MFLDDSDVEIDSGDQDLDGEKEYDQENKSPKVVVKGSPVKEKKLTKSKSARTLRKSRTSLKELCDGKSQPSNRNSGRIHRMSTRSSMDCLI